MAFYFPTTPVVEQFTGPNGPLSPNWLNIVEVGDSALQVYLNAAAGASGLASSATWIPATYLNCEAYISHPVSSVSLSVTAIYLRVANQNSGTARGYIVVNQATGIDVYRWYNNAYSSSLANLGSQILAGTKLGGSCVTSGGDIIVSVFVDTGAGWRLLGAINDVGAVGAFPLLATAGYIGCQTLGAGYTDATRSIDEFGGGEIIPDRTDTPFVLSGRGASW